MSCCKVYFEDLHLKPSTSKQMGFSNGDSAIESLLSSSSSWELSRTSLYDLEDGLLIEILRRLPTAELAIQCKIVSKHWCSLVSTPYFVLRFISHHTSLLPWNHHIPNPRAFVLSYPNKGQFACAIVGDRPLFKYIPREELNRKVVATFNHLVVCRVVDHSDKVWRHYICNPFTMQSVALPPYIAQIEANHRLRMIAQHLQSSIYLVCEPYFREEDGICVLNDEYRYRLVIFTRCRGRYECDVATCISETKEWNKSVLSGVQYAKLSNNIVAYDGKLHWYNGNDIVAYDPFDVNQSFIINFSDRMRDPDGCCEYCIGVCGGSLRVMQLAYNKFAPKYEFACAIWELEEYEENGNA